MTDSTLAKRGWTQEKVEPGNCVQERWRRTGSGVHAEIRRTNTDVEGVIRAADEMADAKKKGELVLKELGTLENAASVVDQLMSVLDVDPPHADELPLAASSV